VGSSPSDSASADQSPQETVEQAVAEQRDLLAEFDIPAHRLTLEITENALLIDPDRVRQVVGELAELGVGRSVDDFGTGYSSLVAVCDLPLTEIKIDRSFVASMVTQQSATTIVRSIIDLAKGLGLRVVAEGVEELDVLHLLRRLGCDVAQGFLISRPLTPERLIPWLQEHHVVDRDRPQDAPALRAVPGRVGA
jgi:EAL domain-containing protein (putative c-di-GMP-specific phosphodiesterase class I)